MIYLNIVLCFKVNALKLSLSLTVVSCTFNLSFEQERSYLDVLSQAVEDLLSHSHCFGEIPLTGLINNVFSRVVPVKVTDRLL